MKQSSHNRKLTRGFTLIELLVVIAIIVILMAILYPVFQSVREKARQSNCQSNLHQISVALKSYREDYGRYPYQPFYNGTRYLGGISALYPDYIPEKKALICPSDRQVTKVTQAARDKVYSSYNGWVADPSASWNFESVTTKSPDGGADVTGTKRTYNWFGYSQDGWDAFYWNSAADTNMPYATALPSWLRNEGLSYRHYPRLANRNAPDNTIITHCVHHRTFYRKELSRMDVMMTIGGSGKIVNVSQMSEPGEDTAHPSRWVSQSD